MRNGNKSGKEGDMNTDIDCIGLGEMIMIHGNYSQDWRTVQILSMNIMMPKAGVIQRSPEGATIDP
jgi:hypothetical protein